MVLEVLMTFQNFDVYNFNPSIPIFYNLVSATFDVENG
jgi:hypothetical protein